MLENDITGALDGTTFSVEEEFFGERMVVELRPRGAAEEVTEANKREYVALAAAHRSSGAIKEQTKAFCEARGARAASAHTPPAARPCRHQSDPPLLPPCSQGFHGLVPLKLLSFIDAEELELLISGLPTLDVDDLQAPPAPPRRPTRRHTPWRSPSGSSHRPRPLAAARLTPRA